MCHVETSAIHSGYTAADHVHAAVPPIYLSAAFHMESADRGDALSAGTQNGFSYSRVANPTVDVLERRIAALEGGRSAVAVASGMAAVSFALLCAAEGGGRIIAPKTLYGASVDAMASFFPQFGVHTDFVDDINDLAEVEALIGPDTRAIFAESVANPSTEVTDVAALAELAHRHGVPLIVDNTVPTPYLFQPIRWGADVVVHSTTKGISGHGNTLGGVIVDAGNFDWGSPRFPQFTQPELVVSDERAGAWHSFASRFGADAYIRRVRIKYVRTFGAVESPVNAYLQLLGLETLAVRVREQTRSAQAIARHLRGVPHVRRVQYSGLALEDEADAGAQAQRVRRLFAHGVGPVLSFELDGGREQVSRVLDGVRVFSYVPNIGDARSLIVDPARITHREVPAEFREAAGVSDNLIRLSVGLEHVDDLIADLDGVIAHAYGV
ncbi:O-acetylhomoserine aminocarboxypropyltransferase [Bifidobacterium pseudolongum subsp. globosum]|uniref:O-acetylhomoserine aminocarboxypropyltransferase/cysteine synthase family protein n=1 Tax=Bifidobacterium pseudolongum TaxID=1694 RepID=UPI0010206D7E|nr:aminotransferase class I/II-fold pyridoxal phosphate-dependent enzyme [Bifidobacterium pseudolongum]RYQ02763.1 O-acetylhomoserine aminocarboxypropyltransferase [Bifidobacterium pseudolongum subsp. globosum]